MNSNLFGTAGVRNTIGTEPFTHLSLVQLGHAIALWALRTYGSHPTILLAQDTRVSCSWVKAALKTGLLAHSVTLYDGGTLPTPANCYLVQHSDEQFDCGIVISASHNGPKYNGIKLIKKNSVTLSLEDELAISRLFYEETLPTPDNNNLGTDIIWPEAQYQYMQDIIKHFPADFLSGKKIVLDCAHGATYHLAPHIFSALGAIVIPINNQPTGYNINQNCGAVHVQGLQKEVLVHHADAGFAFDGDGDRVITVTRNGEIKDGDDMLALLLDNPAYQHEKGVVGTVMTNEGLAAHLHTHNKILHRTPVGEKHVVKKLNEKDMLVGGEQNGHIILKDYLLMGDGIFSALRLLQTLIKTNNWDMRTFVHYPSRLINIRVTTKKDLQAPPLASIIQEYQKKLANGRLVIRYSGTEPVLRILVEAQDIETAEYIGTGLSQELQRQLS